MKTNIENNFKFACYAMNNAKMFLVMVRSRDYCHAVDQFRCLEKNAERVDSEINTQFTKLVELASKLVDDLLVVVSPDSEQREKHNASSRLSRRYVRIRKRILMLDEQLESVRLMLY